VVSQSSAQHADLAGSGDVNQVGLEPLQNLANQWDVAEKRGIEPEVLLKSEREETAREFEGPYVAVFQDSLGAVAGTDAEKGQIVAARKGLKMAACVRYPVYLVKRVGEVGDARDLCIH
jgi:hypothetical protein